MASLWPLFLFLIWACWQPSTQLLVQAQDSSVCTVATPCAEGCCSQYGSCGFGPDFCGDGCISNCNATAQCGEYGGGVECPLNVCCSEYGFCGTTTEFCSTGCQSNCETVTQPSCDVSRTADGLQRKIAYYELFGIDRPCDTMQPEAIPAGALTHINLAFVNFGSDFKMVDEDGDLVARVSKLKLTYAGLRVSVAIGGWSFNDPPTSTYFSDMASSTANRRTFITSLVAYLTKYGLDGVDIDWEYPTAIDRGGSTEDTQNYVLLLADLREAFDKVNPGWEITCTLPSSYWYLQNFDLPSMEKYLSWFNVMSYDLHGMWDQDNEFTGSYLRGHTNLTEIDQGLQLLWRVGIDPANVVLGMGFYGRSFTMADVSCYGPDCEFSAAGNAGLCSQTPGILYYAEVQASNESINVATYYDPVTTVKFTVFNSNQWVSYDDEQSWADKLAFLTGHCLSGLMIWAIDQDTGQYDALAGLLGADATASGLLQGGDLSDDQKQTLADQFAAYTGQNCFVTPECTDGTKQGANSEMYCPSGYSAVTTAHAPVQRPDYYTVGTCPKGEFHYICCPTAEMPKNCAWNGAPERSEIGCTGLCGSDQFTLNTDSYINATGSAGACYSGHRSLCCDSAAILTECGWTDCQDLSGGDSLSCPDGTKLSTSRYDNGAGKYCAVAMGHSSLEHTSYEQAFCCPTDETPQNCLWTFDSSDGTFSQQAVCLPTMCPSAKVQYTTALYPPNEWDGEVDCSAYQALPGQSDQWPYCCDPPSDYNDKWPVDPSYLWESPNTETGADILWAYQDNYGSNSAQSKQDDDYGDDPYGFVMLDGPPGSVDSSFDTTFTVARRTAAEELLVTKRSLVTTNRTLLDSVFDPAGEVLFVFCNFPDDSPRCQHLFHKGAPDTIIKLPAHVGEGPFARVVSIETAPDSYSLPGHHLRKRSASGLDSRVWRLEIDYNFAAIKRDDGPVNMRVDFTNLLDYWEDVTDEPAKLRRDLQDGPMAYDSWRHKVGRAKASHERLRKRQAEVMAGGEAARTHLAARGAHLDADEHESEISRRWFGAFVDWIKKVTTVESSDRGYLNMFFQKSMLLYRGFVGCSRTYAQLDIYLDAEASMDATYAYYFSGALGGLVPTTTYAYLAVQPAVYLGLTINGDARLEYQSPRVALMPTISYPGLAVKGLASVGPTLDLYGQIVGVVQIGGTMQVGARYTFEKSEIYWPDDDTAAPLLNGFDDKPEPVDSGLTPVFHATVQASVDLDIRVTPEAHMGIQIGGGALFGKTLVDAQVVAYVNNTLRFHADATASVDVSGTADLSYNYGVYLLYNVGFGGWATIVGYTWAVQARTLYSTPQSIPLYTNGGVASSSAATKRSLDSVGQLAGRSWNREFDVDNLGSGIFGGDGESVLAQARILSADGDLLWSSGEDVVNISLPHRSGHRSASQFVRRDLSARADLNTDSSENPDFSLGTLTCPPTSCDVDAGSSSDTPTDTSSSKRSVLAKRTPNCAGWRLPDLRYNCRTFLDTVAVSTSGTSGNIPGICSNIYDFYTKVGVASSGLVLTWDSSDINQNVRRRFSCNANIAAFGNSYCFFPNRQVENSIGISATMLSCDEFPFASTEEGGNYYPLAHRLPVNVMCVPVYQQSIQGNCNALLNNLRTNVAYFDDTTAAPNWVPWSASTTGWFDRSTNWQRTTNYSSQIPQSSGITDQEYGPIDGNYLGYNIRRNFTVGLASPTSASDGTAWGPQSAVRWSYYNPITSNLLPTDVTQIMCAVNTFSQSNIYSIYHFNAYCATGDINPNAQGFPQAPRFVACNVQFTANVPIPNSKRGEADRYDDDDDDDEIIGTFNGWGIKSVEILEDQAEPIPMPGFEFDREELVPARWHRKDSV